MTCDHFWLFANCNIKKPSWFVKLFHYHNAAQNVYTLWMAFEMIERIGKVELRKERVRFAIQTDSDKRNSHKMYHMKFVLHYLFSHSIEWISNSDSIKNVHLKRYFDNISQDKKAFWERKSQKASLKREENWNAFMHELEASTRRKLKK